MWDRWSGRATVSREYAFLGSQGSGRKAGQAKLSVSGLLGKELWNTRDARYALQL